MIGPWRRPDSVPPDIAAALRRLLVDALRPAPAVAISPRHGAISVRDKYGRDIKEAA